MDQKIQLVKLFYGNYNNFKKTRNEFLKANKNVKDIPIQSIRDLIKLFDKTGSVIDADVLHVVRKGQNKRKVDRAREKQQNKSSRKSIKRLASQTDEPIDGIQDANTLKKELCRNPKRQRNATVCM